MTIDDKTRTELEAAVFRRLVQPFASPYRRPEHRFDQSGRLLPQLPVELDEGRGRRQGRRRSARTRAARRSTACPTKKWKAKHQGAATPEQLAAMRRPKAGIERYCTNEAILNDVSFRDGALAPARNLSLRCAIAHRSRCFASPRNDRFLISCGRAVDERDVALTQGPPILRVISGKAPCGNACGA